MIFRKDISPSIIANAAKSVVGRTISSIGGTSEAYQNSRNSSRPLDNASLFQAINNALTGNLDYRRQIEAALRAEQVSAREAEKNRQWQERMSNTAYSRAIADLKRNGINPYAIGSFSAASTPSGATGSAYNSGAHSAASSTIAAFGLVSQAISSYQNNMFNIIKTLLPLL